MFNNISQISSARSRSISPENFTGEVGKGAMATEGTGASCARELGKGWKVSPSVFIKAGETFTLADINDEGCIQSIWLATDYIGKNFILRIYWDGQKQPSVECPLSDFFGCGWTDMENDHYTPVPLINSALVAVNPNNALNCFFPMPFKKRCKMTLENRTLNDKFVYYQINYELREVLATEAYFHAQHRHTPIVPSRDVHTILDGVVGEGQYIGTMMYVGLNGANGWWGEGEVKFYLDGDDEFPTICTTGTEDYFGGAWNWDIDKKYTTYTTNYSGMHQVVQPDGLYRSQQRFSMYRWHVVDPVRFKKDLRVTVQDLGWKNEKTFGERTYLSRNDDITTVSFWYQTLPTAPFPTLENRAEIELV